ncbi:MAG: methyltransferase domain-containing protein [Methanomassiliicoccales archaeon]|nr:methyltransferase domain-containing protein [Methanomassiliicoccales archaeon]
MNFYGQVRRPAGVQGMIIARRMNHNHRGMMRWALEHMDASSVESMLDLGCGGGGPLSMLSESTPNTRFVALDLSKDMLRMTCKVNARLVDEERLSTVRASVSSLPFSDRSFDAVLACETTYFWPDLCRDLKECRRVLKDDGRLFLVQETWDAPQWRERNESWQKGFRMTFHSLDGYRSLLLKAGFARVTMHTEEGEGWFVMEASVR